MSTLKMTNSLTGLLHFNGKISRSTFNNFEATIIAFCLFLLIPPFYVWHSVSPLFFGFIITLFAIWKIRKIGKKQFLFLIAFFLVYLYIPMRNGSNLFGIIQFMTLLSFLIFPPNLLNAIFKKFILIYSITLIPSILVYILVNFIKIDLSSTFIEPLNQVKMHDYIRYPFLVEANMPMEIILPRFCGYYDEPGVIGTISGVILICTNFNLKKKVNIPIFIAGLISFSFAFYLIAIIYGFVFFSLKFKVALAIITISITILFSENELLYGYLFSRFEYSDGKLAGDNRAQDSTFENWYKQYSESGVYLIGLGQSEGMKHNLESSSYKNVIVNYGIVFFVLLIGLYALRGYSQLHLGKALFVYFLILLLILYQRPNISDYFYLFLILAPTTFLYNQKLESIASKQAF